jgi:N-acetylglutamate synthase-like GNAT family acetyltransferase
MNDFTVRPSGKDDKNWITDLLTEWWASPTVVSRGKIHYADNLPGFIVERDNKPAGLSTYNINGTNCEIVTINSLVENIGIGSALIDEVKQAARRTGCKRLWLITTNDNTAAMRFYQKRGFVFVAVHRNSIEQSRRLKPEIPTIGNDGIPIRDEIEFELSL